MAKQYAKVSKRLADKYKEPYAFAMNYIRTLSLDCPCHNPQLLRKQNDANLEDLMDTDFSVNPRPININNWTAAHCANIMFNINYNVSSTFIASS